MGWALRLRWVQVEKGSRELTKGLRVYVDFSRYAFPGWKSKGHHLFRASPDFGRDPNRMLGTSLSSIEKPRSKARLENKKPSA